MQDWKGQLSQCLCPVMEHCIVSALWFSRSRHLDTPVAQTSKSFVLASNLKNIPHILQFTSFHFHSEMLTIAHLSSCYLSYFSYPRTGLRTVFDMARLREDLHLNRRDTHGVLANLCRIFEGPRQSLSTSDDSDDSDDKQRKANIKQKQT